MNLKTTLVLLVLAAATAALGAATSSATTWCRAGVAARRPRTRVRGLGVLEKELTPEHLTAASRWPRATGRSYWSAAADGEWSLPGKWPARQAEADGLVSTARRPALALRAVAAAGRAARLRRRSASTSRR